MNPARTLALFHLLLIVLQLSAQTNGRYEIVNSGVKAYVYVAQGEVVVEYPALLNGTSGQGSVEWGAIKPSEHRILSLLSGGRFGLGNEPALAVAAKDQIGKESIYILTPRWGGFEFKVALTGLSAPLGEKIQGCKLDIRLQDSVFDTFWSESTLVIRISKDGILSSKAYPLNGSGAVVGEYFYNTHSDKTSGLLVLVVRQIEGWIPLIWTLSPYGVEPWNSNGLAEVEGNFEGGVLTLSSIQTPEKILRLKNGLDRGLWTLTGSRVDGGRSWTLTQSPEKQYTTSLQDPAIFVWKTQSGLAGQVTSALGYDDLRHWKIDLPSSPAVWTPPRPQDGGFVMWTVGTETLPLVHRIEVTNQGFISIYPAGRIDPAPQVIRFVLKSGNWTLEESPGERSWIYDNTTSNFKLVLTATPGGDK